MDRSLLLLSTLSLACASTSGSTGPDSAEEVVLQVEESLREAEAAVDAGDAGKARTLIADSEALIQKELGHAPDRHQLLSHAAELRARIDRPKTMLASAVAPAPAPVIVPEPPKEIVEAIQEEESSGEEDAVTAFEEGPLRDHGKALKMLRTAKRAPKKVSRRLIAEARALLESCATEGGRLVGSSPDLQEKTFKLGSRDQSAQSIVFGCKSKVRSLDRPKKAKRTKKTKRKFRQS